MSRTKPKNDEQMLIRVSADLKQKVFDAASEDKVSISEWLRRAILCYLSAREQEETGVTVDYKTAILRCLDDEEFRQEFIQRLNDA